MIRRAKHGLAVLTLAIPIASCGHVPASGTVTNHSHSAAWVQFIPGVTICSNGSCRMTPGQVIPWPESWSVEVSNGPDRGSVDVDAWVYHQCPIKAHWPECSR